MIYRLATLIALAGSLVGCAAIAPAEFSEAFEGHVRSTKDATGVAALAAQHVPAALHQVESKLGQQPRIFSILVCNSSCFRKYVPVLGAAAAQSGDRIYLNADLLKQSDIKSILTHELTHSLIEERRGQQLKKVPEWANEGIAVWVSGVGTAGCANAEIHTKRHPICQALTVSDWLNALGKTDTAAQRCWLDEMVEGRPNPECATSGVIALETGLRLP